MSRAFFLRFDKTQDSAPKGKILITNHADNHGCLEKNLSREFWKAHARGRPPVKDGFAEANVPAQWQNYTPMNAERSAAIKADGSGHITEKGDAKEGPNCKKKG